MFTEAKVEEMQKKIGYSNVIVRLIERQGGVSELIFTIIWLCHSERSRRIYSLYEQEKRCFTTFSMTG